MNAALLAFLLLALLLLQGRIFRRRALKNLSYERRFSQRAAFADQTVELIEVIRNKKLLPLPWLRVESRLSNSLRFGSTQASAEESRSISASDGVSYHRSAFFLGPYSQVTRRHQVTPLKRGVYSARSVALTCGDLFGAAQAQQELDVGAELIVYPRLLDEEAVQIPSSHFQGDLSVRRWIAPDPFLVGGIRPYQAGDPQRDVHWAATARTGSLQVKTRDYTADPQLLVILNVQLKENQWGDLMEYEQASIEHAISYAATLCLKALHSGVSAGFAANAPLEEKGESVILFPQRGAERDTELLELLARLKITKVKNLHSFLDDLGGLSGLDIVLLTAYTSELIEERVQALRLFGNSVSIFWPQGGATS